MSEYISRRYTDKLDNRIIDITYDDIKNMYYENERDARECEEVTRDTYAGNNYYSDNPNNFRFEFYKECLYRDPKTAGFIMQYPHGLIIRQAERNNYYRGENQIYAKSVPSLTRKLYKFDSKEDKELYKLVADMRIAEFGTFIFQFDYVKNWATYYGDVLPIGFQPFMRCHMQYGYGIKMIDEYPLQEDFSIEKEYGIKLMTRKIAYGR